jgi:hypothetical protein
MAASVRVAVTIEMDSFVARSAIFSVAGHNLQWRRRDDD